eukprot:TRINITY_DN2478_c0_g1_i1.p1 TRINITY_DN2478_c0_g1~~TRINITY_DN2478_c0_g1_i1.p1  ORF type:complete len:159 (-),score=44.77 TRINITY_DN2478_c0_g1_i1:69-545(-)
MSQQPPLSKRVFQKYDKDNSGQLDSDEFNELTYSLGYYMNGKEIQEALKIIDKDNSGKISYEEFFEWWRNTDRFKQFPMEEKSERWQRGFDNLVLNFRHFDKDKGGKLDHQEYNAFGEHLKKSGWTLPWPTLKEIDSDNSGQISLNEFTSFFYKYIPN